MNVFATIEDAFLELLEPVKATRGGPIRELEATGQESMDELLRRLFAAGEKGTACFVIVAGMKASPMRNGGLQDGNYTISLLLSARNFRGPDSARRGEAGEPGVYDLLQACRDLLAGQQPVGLNSGAIALISEKQFAAKASQIVWRQDWSLTLF